MRPRASLTADVELREPQELGWLRRQHDQLMALEALKVIKQQLTPEAEAIERQLRNQSGLPASFITECVRSRGEARRRALRLAEPTHSPTTYSDAELGEKQIGFGGVLVFCNGASISLLDKSIGYQAIESLLFTPIETFGLF